MSSIALGVNIDHVATLRNTRNTKYPDLIEVVNIAVAHGADFITVHLREDRRHIRDDDVFRLKDSLNVPLNLEIAAIDEMLAIAIAVQPECVCLVPEKRQELTTEGGLNVEHMFSDLVPVIAKLHHHNIKVTLFVEPDINQINYAIRLSADNVELHTGIYCNHNTQNELDKILEAAKHCYTHKIGCHAGHGLDYQSAATIARVPYISALNIGHFLICEAVLHGIGTSIYKMKQAITNPL